VTYSLVRPLLFRFDPENTHNRILRLLALAAAGRAGRRALARAYGFDDPRLESEAFGLRFRNPIGLSAGYDKDAVAVGGLAALGFGHVEVGTITRQPQPGNDRPRVFRLPEEQALINSMGFPSLGAEAVRPRLAAGRRAAAGAVVGANFGKNKATPLDRAVDDYTGCLRVLGASADYASVNISSPNTAGLRDLQARDYLEPLLKELLRVRDEAAPGLPVLVKIAPDLTYDELDEIVGVAMGAGVSGLIATNALKSLPPRQPGGLSGPPLRQKATDIVRHIARQTGGRLPIIGVGGVCDAASALEKLQAGASLVQVFTGLIFEGPSLVRRINQGLATWMDNRGIKSISEVVGGDR
jgi:dihydroorotate dehydrogenase